MNSKEIKLKIIEAGYKAVELMKKHVFSIQSVSPKKIVLKFKRKLHGKNILGDGCYVFKNPEGTLLKPDKIFKESDKRAKEEALNELAKKKALDKELESVKEELGNK